MYFTLIIKIEINHLNEKCLDDNKDNFSIYQKIIDKIGLSYFNSKVYLILALFFLADGGEMVVLSLITTKLSNKWNLSSSEKGLLGSSVSIGTFFGALLCGSYSDVIGRKPVFIVGSVIVTFFAFFSALINDYFSFFICRGICGLGIGLSIPSAFSLATEIIPSKFRHIAITMIWFFFPFGEIFIICLSKLLLKYDNGWRFILAFASLPCLIALILSFSIYESPKFLFTVGKYKEGIVILKKLVQLSKLDFKFDENIESKLREEFEKNDSHFYGDQHIYDRDSINENNKHKKDSNFLGYKNNLNSKEENEKKTHFNNNNINKIEEKNLTTYFTYDFKHDNKNCYFQKNSSEIKDLKVIGNGKMISSDFKFSKYTDDKTGKNDSGLLNKLLKLWYSKEVVKPVKFKDLLNKKYKLVTILIWIILVLDFLYGLFEVFCHEIILKPKIQEKCSKLN